jgi:hypothetical protein
MAHDRGTDWIEREGADGKKVRVFNSENFRQGRPDAPQCRLNCPPPGRR